MKTLGVKRGDRVTIYLPMVTGSRCRDVGLRSGRAIHSVCWRIFARTAW